MREKLTTTTTYKIPETPASVEAGNSPERIWWAALTLLREKTQAEQGNYPTICGYVVGKLESLETPQLLEMLQREAEQTSLLTHLIDRAWVERLKNERPRER